MLISTAPLLNIQNPHPAIRLTLQSAFTSKSSPPFSRSRPAQLLAPSSAPTMAFAASQPLTLRSVTPPPLSVASRRPCAARPMRTGRGVAPTMVQLNAPKPKQGVSAADTLASTKLFSILLELIAVSQIPTSALRGTLFAPTNPAFKRLSAELLSSLRSDRALAADVIGRHLIPNVMPTSKLTGNAFLDGSFGGPLGYTSYGGAQLRVGGAAVGMRDLFFDGGVIHAIDAVLRPPNQTWPSFEQTYVSASPPPPPLRRSTKSMVRALGATKPSTVGGRKAMGLITQLPFWMYGPPYNALKQEEYEPISIAVPDVSSVDYQVMPPGTVIVSPDAVDSNKLNPVSGMSKYIGKTKRLVGDDALSDYSRLD